MSPVEQEVERISEVAASTNSLPICLEHGLHFNFSFMPHLRTSSVPRLPPRFPQQHNPAPLQCTVSFPPSLVIPILPWSRLSNQE
ncbi:hypothetical protein BS47DRAFT_927528 [Hydnum rufescens UP504]|uniref:Uncharacterized protein n=1 Tax=Hydnum rufescens UP504 TaxID=1448309 RepID=A0A9P6B974_9AGAM|nr:hypothetical protein BS47DRAFT_927528 [Hydnum rufescens UP504]